MPPLLLLAASGLAREALAAIEARGDQDVVGVLDDDRSRRGMRVGGTSVLGSVDEAERFPEAQLVICAGRGASRRAIVGRLEALQIGPERYGTVLDPTAVIPSSCEVGSGSIVLAHCVLTADVTIGRHVVAMPHVVLTHDDQVADFATLCAGVVLGGSVRIGEAAYLGMASSVREGLQVGSDAVLGMGAVLVTDLPSAQVWTGVPARHRESRAA